MLQNRIQILYKNKTYNAQSDFCSPFIWFKVRESTGTIKFRNNGVRAQIWKHLYCFHHHGAQEPEALVQTCLSQQTGHKKQQI